MYDELDNIDFSGKKVAYFGAGDQIGYSVYPYTRTIMSNLTEVLCLSASPHLQVFDRPLLESLAQHTPIAQWHYQQTPDEPCSLDIALVLLHDYLQHRHQPIHLIGHGRRLTYHYQQCPVLGYLSAPTNSHRVSAGEYSHLRTLGVERALLIKATVFAGD